MMTVVIDRQSHAWQWWFVAASAIWGVCLLLAGLSPRLFPADETPWEPSLSLAGITDDTEALLGAMLLLAAVLMLAARARRYTDTMFMLRAEAWSLFLLFVAWGVMGCVFATMNPTKPLPYVLAGAVAGGAATRWCTVRRSQRRQRRASGVAR